MEKENHFPYTNMYIYALHMGNTSNSFIESSNKEKGIIVHMYLHLYVLFYAVKSKDQNTLDKIFLFNYLKIFYIANTSC